MIKNIITFILILIIISVDIQIDSKIDKRFHIVKYSFFRKRKQLKIPKFFK